MRAPTRILILATLFASGDVPSRGAPPSQILIYLEGGSYRSPGFYLGGQFHAQPGNYSFPSGYFAPYSEPFAPAVPNVHGAYLIFLKGGSYWSPGFYLGGRFFARPGYSSFSSGYFAQVVSPFATAGPITPRTGGLDSRYSSRALLHWAAGRENPLAKPWLRPLD